MKIAYLFPGQGLQKPGMGNKFFGNSKHARDLYAKASEAMRMSLDDFAALCFDEIRCSELNKTENTQPAVLVTSIAAYEAFKKEVENGELDIEIAAGAGHSLGQYAALVAAGSLEFKRAVELVHVRGKYMQLFSPEGYGMAAMHGLNENVLDDICRRTGTVISNYNSPNEIIISGRRSSLESAAEMAGGKCRILEKIRIPFHSQWLKDAQTAFRVELSGYAVNDASFPVISNKTAEELKHGPLIKDDLVEQITGQVLWHRSMQKILDLGVRDFIAFGPAGALRSWMRDIDRTANVYVVDSPASVEKTIYQLNNARATRVA